MDKCEKCGMNLKDNCFIVWKCQECGKAFKLSLEKLNKIQELKMKNAGKHLLKCSSCGHPLDDRNEKIICKCLLCGHVREGNLECFASSEINAVSSVESDADHHNFSMIECPECGKKILSDSKMCSYCGYPLEDEILDSDKNCDYLNKKKNNKIILIVSTFLALGICFGFFLIVKNNHVMYKEEQNTMIEAYKSEAHYYYEQVNGIIKNLNVVEEFDNNGSIEDSFFSSTVNEMVFKSICLENLISVNQYYSNLEISSEEIKNLYTAISKNEEIENINDIIDGLNVECMELKKMLERATEYNSNFIDGYNVVLRNITSQADLLYDYIYETEIALHNTEVNENVSKEYKEELEKIKQIGFNEDEKNKDIQQKRDINNPMLEGESINIKYLDFTERNSQDNSACEVDCIITFKSYDKEAKVVCINYEIVSSEKNSAVYVGDAVLGSSSLVYILVDENLATTYVYNEDIYGKDTWNHLIGAYEHGNVDCNINVGDNKYLQICFSPATDENRELSRENKNCSEEFIWVELK